MSAVLPTGTRGARWTGHILAGAAILALLVDAGVSIFAPQLMANDLARTGFAIALSPVIGGVLLACLVLYAIPRTSVLGAILLTGFLGGAICTHMRIGEMGSPPQIVSAVLGIAVWASLYLRLDAVRALLPLTGLSGAR
ncbi:DoxX family protein [Variovorax sp. dw_954]|uniref:DoxX family protein n=1 Tax=Variovorax sp. dw_954 TaxID=2720078 RepID=UPI001BD2ECE8|nr:DoxX family protein [Variovorax sp. dw_954]